MSRNAFKNHEDKSDQAYLTQAIQFLDDVKYYDELLYKLETLTKSLRKTESAEFDTIEKYLMSIPEGDPISLQVISQNTIKDTNRVEKHLLHLIKLNPEFGTYMPSGKVFTKGSEVIPGAKTPDTIYIEELGKSVNLCCSYAARLGDGYCQCGRAIPEELRLAINGIQN